MHRVEDDENNEEEFSKCQEPTRRSLPRLVKQAGKRHCDCDESPIGVKKKKS